MGAARRRETLEAVQMTIVRRRYAFPELPTFRTAFERFLEEPFVRPSEWLTLGAEGVHMPLIDAYATKEAFIVKVALPGVQAEKVETTIEGDTLSIRGSFEPFVEKEETGYLFHELPRGEFRRSLVLPAGLKTEAVDATFEHGLLTLVLPKAEEIKPRHITVKAR
jgi:HSP20 family protein